MITRRSFLIGAGSTSFFAAATTSQAIASEPRWYSSDEIVIGGYDPVAYFTQAKPVKGMAQHQKTYEGGVFYFASEENMALFQSEPQRYAPQYGGYCAYAVSRNYTASTSPKAWTVHEGKLYLNYSKIVRGLWARDIPGYIAKGDANWPGVLG